MANVEFCAPCLFGIEGILGDELRRMGAENVRPENGRVLFAGDMEPVSYTHLMVEEELGDLLFSAVNVSRFVKTDAEQALTGATDKFIRRFARVEQLARERGLDMSASSLEELDALWKEAKREQAAPPGK